jgi:hypothetical protein
VRFGGSFQVECLVATRLPGQLSTRAKTGLIPISLF